MNAGAQQVAFTTLKRGTRFLTALAAEPRLTRPWPDGRDRGVRARFFANCLGELDRFLHILMDETAPALSVAPAPDQRNAANKIACLTGEAATTPDRRRLRALGRTRACLWHCHGLVRRPDAPDASWMTAGWPHPRTATLQRYRLGEHLAPAGAELADVSLFYEQLAERLIAVAPT